MEVYSGFPLVLLLTCWAGQLTYGNPINSNSTDAPTTSTNACQCGMKGDKGEPSQDYIIGGDEAKEHEHPWQVGLETWWNRGPVCGGTLISSTHVLTAAHCTVHSGTEEKLPVSSIKVLLGEHNVADREINKVDVAEIINHPDYKFKGKTNKFKEHLLNDYSILRLANPVPFTKKVSPACLPADLSSTYAGSPPQPPAGAGAGQPTPHQILTSCMRWTSRL